MADEIVTTEPDAPAATEYDATEAAVRRKLNITWEDDGTDARVTDIIGAVSPELALRCGLDASHVFAPTDPEWPLFLNACLYEFSDALDDFWTNYASSIAIAHVRNTICANLGGE